MRLIAWIKSLFVCEYKCSLCGQTRWWCWNLAWALLDMGIITSAKKHLMPGERLVQSPFIKDQFILETLVCKKCITH